MTTILKDLKILALDCQTTGANPDKGHLLEIGWLPARASLPEKSKILQPRTYLIHLPAKAVIPRAVQRITGITDESLQTAASAKIVWKHLAKTAKKVMFGNQAVVCPTVIHFARFEEPFLRELHKNNDPQGPFPFQIICTHEIAIRLLPNLPRRGIRAVAGYLGHCLPEFKRSADHAIATVFIWKKMIELLNTTCGISRLDQLTDWLASTIPAGRLLRAFPMKPQTRLRLPDSPGIYRMLSANDQLLYIGKAKSLKSRVNSYFRQKAPHTERTLEMLTQARELDFTQTGSALEAAMLESDEIKHHSPPYNIALRRHRRRLVFFSKDLRRLSPQAGNECSIGPLPGGKSIEALSAFGLWLRRGMRLAGNSYTDIGYSVLALPPEYAPDVKCLKDGFRIFQENYRSRLKRQSPLRFLTGLGAALWRERMEIATLAETVEEKENDHTDVDEREKGSGEEPIWTAEAVARFIEKMVLHNAHLIRRTRWFCLLSESSLAWASADRPGEYKKRIIFENGSVLKRDDVKATETNPVPPGFYKSFRVRQSNIDLITYDRLRVVTTELRRLISEGRKIELRLSPRVTLDGQKVMKALRWV
jgi:DNA polymerase-3 subunit epsilon